MLDNKGKKTLLIVILGVCAVSFIAALVSAFATSLNMMINMDRVTSMGVSLLSYGRKIVIMGALLMGLVVLGVLYAVLCFKLREKIKRISVVICSVAVAYAIAMIVVGYVVMLPDSGNEIGYNAYSMFESILSVTLSVVLPMVLSTVSIFCLHKLNAKEQEPQQE